MHANAKLEDVVRPMADLELLDGGQEVQRHGGDLAGVLQAVTVRQAADHHVGIADCLHFVDVVVFDDVVEQCVQVVEHVHHLTQTVAFFITFNVTQPKKLERNARK